MSYRHALLPVLLTSTLLLGACANSGDDPVSSTESSATPSSSAVGAEVAADAPQRIVAVTSDVAGIVLALTGGDRVVGVPASVKAGKGPQAEAARNVEATLPPGTDPEIEQILAMKPDLVIETARHGGEKTLATQLTATGVTSLVISPEDLTSPEGVAKVTRSIGEAIGMSGAAEEKISAFNKEIETLDAKAASGSSHPSALALMSRGPQVMAMDGGLMLPGLISRAGGEYAAERIGLKSTRPIDAEQLVKANPDVLFLEDFQGQGRAPFEELLNNPAVAEVPAIKNNRIHVMSQTEASSVSGLNTAVGFEKIISAIHEDTN